MQGFTLGEGFMYWSFTDCIIKTDLDGNVICGTDIIGGHLGDCDYRNGKIYASYLKNSLPGHPWEDWTGFKIYVFDASDLTVLNIINLDICDYYKSITCTDNDTRGFQGIDGVTIAPDTADGREKLFVACALYTGERYSNQIILRFDLDGKYETEYHIPTGNTVYGIQNLDYDWHDKEFWFTTYGAAYPYQPAEVLYCLSDDLKTIKQSYRYSTPYGIECLGNGEFYASLDYGENGNKSGIAYRCTQSQFREPKSFTEILKDLRSSN